MLLVFLIIAVFSYNKPLHGFTNIFSSAINGPILLKYIQDWTVNLDVKHTRGHAKALCSSFTQETL